MDQQRLHELIDKLRLGTASDSEQLELEGLNAEFENKPGYTDQLSSDQREIYRELFFSRIQHRIEQFPTRRLPLVKKTNYAWTAIAAAIVVLVVGGALYFTQFRGKVPAATELAKDVAPGHIGATLTLASGEKIRLSGAANGELAKQTGVVISKTADGQLIYQVVGPTDGTAKMNTLSTSNGETYKVILPDGTQVWLNAASKLTYPTSFASQPQRRVNLSGEGYFEVAKDKMHPFIVETTGQEVEVLGTHFNISSYTDESLVTTTLLEGSVKVKDRILKPGQASLVAGNTIKVQEVDTELAIAWKNGAFMFDEEPLSSIMRKVARWYNVEVVYADGVNKDALFGGGVSRYDNISKVLENLELTKNIHFKIEGRRITVTR